MARNNLSPSEVLVDFTGEEEGFRGTAYQDIAGVWTIGYGTTWYRIGPKSGRYVAPGDTISIDDAKSELRYTLANCGKFVDKNVTVALTQGQFDALCDFVYNLGQGAFYHSTLLTMLNSGDYDGAYNQFPLWCHAGGKYVQDLYDRRLGEQKLWKGIGYETGSDKPVG